MYLCLCRVVFSCGIYGCMNWWSSLKTGQSQNRITHNTIAYKRTHIQACCFKCSPKTIVLDPRQIDTFHLNAIDKVHSSQQFIVLVFCAWIFILLFVIRTHKHTIELTKNQTIYKTEQHITSWVFTVCFSVASILGLFRSNFDLFSPLDLIRFRHTTTQMPRTRRVIVWILSAVAMVCWWPGCCHCCRCYCCWWCCWCCCCCCHCQPLHKEHKT